jgi:hypothetical protein
VLRLHVVTNHVPPDQARHSPRLRPRNYYRSYMLRGPQELAAANHRAVTRFIELIRSCRDDAGPPHAKRRGLVVDAAATFPAGDELCGFAALMATMIRSGR